MKVSGLNSSLNKKENLNFKASKIIAKTPDDVKTIFRRMSILYHTSPFEGKSRGGLMMLNDFLDSFKFRLSDDQMNLLHKKGKNIVLSPMEQDKIFVSRFEKKISDEELIGLIEKMCKKAKKVTMKLSDNVNDSFKSLKAKLNKLLGSKEEKSLMKFGLI